MGGIRGTLSAVPGSLSRPFAAPSAAVIGLISFGLYGLYGLERSLATAPRHPSGQRATQLGQDVEVGIRVRDQGVGVCGGNGLLLGSSRDQLRYNRYLVRDG